jgi:sirohydrochlorin cobaltochelatase
MKQSIVLFAHGSRDPLWSKPIEAIAQAIFAASAQCEVRCAYLEFMAPTLAAAIAELEACHVTNIRIVPMFLGVGKHAREDLPNIAEALQRDYPNLTLELQPSIGEHPELITAIANILTKNL